MPALNFDEMPSEARIKLEDLTALTRGETPKATGVRRIGDRVNITLLDHDQVVPGGRGVTIRGLEFMGWFPYYPGTNGKEMTAPDQMVWYHNPDMRLAFVHAQLDTQEAFDLATPEVLGGLGWSGKEFDPASPIVFGFHGWLIERIQKVIVDPPEIDHEVERWHNGDGDAEQLHEHLGWTWKQYARHVEGNIIPYTNGADS